MQQAIGPGQAMKLNVMVLFAVLFLGCSRSDESSRPSWEPLQMEDGWDVSSAEEISLNTCLLDSMTAAIRRSQDYPNVHALLIVKDNRLVFEQYFEGDDLRYVGDQRQRVSLEFDAETLHDSRSVGKSVTSALVGIALGSEEISSLDTPLFDYFPEHASLETPRKRKITLRHALSMSAGLEWNEMDVPYTDPSNHEEQMNQRSRPEEFVLSRSVAAEPGSTFYYNGGLPVVLGMVVSRASGQPFGDYARERLFKPLGITNVEWGGPSAWSTIPELQWDSDKPWARTAAPFGALWMRPRDFAKFGSLYLNDGRWKDRQILPKGWAMESTRRLFTVRNDESDEYGEFGYGYFWWYNLFATPQGELEVHTAVGNGEQRIYVIPSLNTLVVHLAGRYNEDGEWMSERLLLNYIVPAIRGLNSGSPSICGRSAN